MRQLCRRTGPLVALALLATGLMPGVATASAGQAAVTASQQQAAHTDAPARIESALGPDFAGVWFARASGRLAVGVPQGVDPSVAEAAISEAGMSGNAEVVHVTSAWHELLSTQEEWDGRLSGLLAKQEAQTGIDARANAVSVKLSRSVAAATRQSLEGEAAASAVKVVVTVAPASQFAIVASVGHTTTCSFPFCDKPITPGVEVVSSVEAKTEEWTICTAGPMVLDSASYTYMLLAGHCVKAMKNGETEPWYSSYPGGTETGAIGYVKEKSTHLGSGGDFTEVLINSAFWTEPGVFPVYADMAEWGLESLSSHVVHGEFASVEGTMNCHEGRTSREQCGEVGETNKTVAITYHINGKEKVIEVKGLDEDTACGAPGDSGGPWFQPYALGEVLVEGTDVAGPEEECPNGGPAFYEPIHTILTKEKVSLLTPENEER